MVQFVFQAPVGAQRHAWDVEGRRALWNQYIKLFGDIPISAMHSIRCQARGTPTEMKTAFEHCRQYDRIPETTQAVVTVDDLTWKSLGGAKDRHNWVGFPLPIKETENGSSCD